MPVAPLQAMSRSTRQVLAVFLCVAMLGAIGAAFWHQDLRYSLPTPRPAGWTATPVGTRIPLPPAIEALRAARPGSPVHLHFFNPDCPCSRFNVDHVRDLVRAHGSDVVFVAVLRDASPDVLERAYRKLALAIPFVVDEGPLSDAVGAYSTPHAVILDGDGRLYYEGNYNVTRYCRDRETEFARLALERVLAGGPPPVFETAASVAYGCPLPDRRRAPAGAL